MTVKEEGAERGTKGISRTKMREFGEGKCSVINEAGDNEIFWGNER